MENPKFPMREMDDNYTSAGDRPTNLQPPVTSLEDLKDKVLSKAMDLYGCVLLHEKLQEGKPEDIQIIFSELKDHICTLMLDHFGSFVIRKLFEFCDEERMNQLVFSVTADVRLLMSVCLHSQGSESMKKFLECRMTPKQISHMISVFSYFTVPLVNHQIGSRVIAHCFEIFPIPAKETRPILQVIDNNFMEIAVNKSGSCLLQVLISGFGKGKYGLGGILSAIILNVYDLSTNQFGSLVVQHVIGLEIPDLLKYLVDHMKGAFADLSLDEYASLVVQKLMGASGGEYAPQIIDEIICSPRFLYVLVEPCGYSLLESAKNYCEGTVRKTLNDLISQHSQQLNKK